MAIVTVTFSLDTEKHKGLVLWLDGLERGQKSHAIRTALIEHIKGAVTLREVYEAIEELKRTGVVLSARHTEKSGAVPPDILNNLSKLGL